MEKQILDFNATLNIGSIIKEPCAASILNKVSDKTGC